MTSKQPANVSQVPFTIRRALPSIPLSELTGMEIFANSTICRGQEVLRERGARNALAQLPADQKKRGVIAASAGNHAQALAYQGKLLGIPASVVMPKFAPLLKITNCQKLGATVVLHGDDFGEARARADEIAKEKGLAYIDGYDNPAIIAGQGTMGLEIIEQIPEADAIIIPVGGAGLLAGVSLAVKSARPTSENCRRRSRECGELFRRASCGQTNKNHHAPQLGRRTRNSTGRR
jgi:threonine dehydratase